MQKILTWLLLALAGLALGCSGGSGEQNRSGAFEIDPADLEGLSDARQLAVRMDAPPRLLVGLGAGNPVSAIQSQALTPDILDRYLPDKPDQSWVNYDSPPGAYVTRVTEQARALGAVPMFTLYQFAIEGEDNPAMLTNRALMADYWQHVVILFDRLGEFARPALVNLEPDFWGFSYRFSPDNDPARRTALVNITPDCADLPNTVAGVGQCLLTIARARAPFALIGFPPSDFGFGTDNVIGFMNAVGAADADFIVMQTLDRDTGCFEARTASNCQRPGNDQYWGDAQFAAHFDTARRYHEGIGGLPLIWWQTPLGVPSQTPGGSPKRWRDNRVDTFLRTPQALVDAGGVAVVFSAGATNQTDIRTDGGQFQARWQAYINDPVALPE